MTVPFRPGFLDSSHIQEAKAFLEKSQGMSDDDLETALNELPRAVRQAYHDLKKAAFFIPENAVIERRTEHLSSSGQFRLVVTPYRTKTGSWNYTQGIVYRVGSNTPIAEIQRNYAVFPYLFIEDHPEGPFLVAGADYQGQTVVSLTTGNRCDFVPEDADIGIGFCWAEYRYDAATQILIVDGCIWACPYEFRFYDFSHPIKAGWPEIEPESFIEADGKWPEIESDGTIKCYQTSGDGVTTIDSITTYKREGLNLHLVDQWLSEDEGRRREKQKAEQARYEAWKESFRSSDPLYLEFLEGLKDPALSVDEFEYTGITYEGWCPGFDKQERRWGRRVLTNPSVDLEWAVDTGPIQVVVRAQPEMTKMFEHSAEGMTEALAYVKSLALAREAL